MKKLFRYEQRKPDGFHQFWLWKLALITTLSMDHPKFLDVCTAKRGILFVFGKLVVGFGYAA